jgi:hypothetical protein
METKNKRFKKGALTGYKVKKKKPEDTKAQLSNALENVPKDIAKIIKRLKVKADIRAQALDTAGEIQKEIAPDGKLAPEQMWTPIAPMPTDMCRVSPFFPMARQKLGDRPFIRDMVITSSSWGEIKYTGPKLSTYEEDVLMALLSILDQASHR